MIGRSLRVIIRFRATSVNGSSCLIVTIRLPSFRHPCCWTGRVARRAGDAGSAAALFASAVAHCGTYFPLIVKRNVVPTPSWLSTQIRPLYVSTMLFTLASPTPLPAVFAPQFFPRRKTKKTLSTSRDDSESVSLT